MVSSLSEECNRLVFEAVKEDSLSKLQLAKTTYNPIQLLTSLAQCNEEGKTPIIVAMERGNDSVIKKLVTWMSKDKTNFLKNEEWRPIYIIIIDQLIHHIPVIELISHLIVNPHDPISREGLVELIGLLFLQSTSLSRQDKITAQELIGALVIIYYFYHDCCESKSRFALKCWKEAMTLRYFPQDGEPLLPKVPAIYVPTRASSIIFGSAAEIMTMEEIKLLEEDSMNEDYWIPFKEQLLIQALLVMRRIFTDLGHPHGLYLESLLEYEDIMFVHETPELRFSMRTMSKNISINTYIFILEQLNGVDPKLLSHRSFDAFATTILHLTYRLLQLIKEKIREEESESDLAEEESDSESYYSAQEEPAEPDDPAIEKLFFEYLLALTKFIVRISEFFPNPIQISSYRFIDGNYFAGIVDCLMSILDLISSQITDQEKQQLEEYFSYFIKNFFPERTSTVLHTEAMKAYSLTFKRYGLFEWEKTSRKTLRLKEIHTRIKLILHLGADVNAIDERGRTPLHILAPTRENHWKEYVNIFQTLVDAGSNLYLADYYGETVISILRRNIERNQNNGASQHYFESLISDVFPLTKCCARVIRRHRIPFLKDQLPLTLQKLVSP
jgi:ankyrin repeat protein